jgi:hypothetical protein
MATKTGQRGRPTKPGKPGEKTTLSLRMTAELKQRLEDAGSSSGRNLSQEAERRLENSFRDDEILDRALDLALGRQTAGLVQLLTRVVRDAGTHAGFMTTQTPDGATNWLSDPYAFKQASIAITTALEALQPDGDDKPPRMPEGPPGAPDLNKTLASLGRGIANGALQAIIGRARGPRGNDGELARWAVPVRERLGREAVERIRNTQRKPTDVVVAGGPLMLEVIRNG